MAMIMVMTAKVRGWQQSDDGDHPSYYLVYVVPYTFVYLHAI